ncbi:MAG: M48 family metallopeptidase [Pseudonocardia sp.]|nr:M48 family metallopeptidase [Pseudonocardia sp.]
MAVFSSTDFLHPLDWSARQQLENVPMLRQATQRYMSYYGDRRHRQLLLSHAVRLGPRQLPKIYKLLPPICDAFGISEPELFVRVGPPNTETVGHSWTAIVIGNQLLEDLDEDEIQAILAHECGHILVEHVLYRQMAISLMKAGSAATPLKAIAAAELAKVRINAALLDWYRKSELTADRAAATFMGTPEPLQRGLLRTLGLSKWMRGQVSFEEFANQAHEFDEITTDASKWDQWIGRNLGSDVTHPAPAIRMRELMSWSSSESYQQLLTLRRQECRAGVGECSACGHPLVDAWRFCDHCGVSIPRARHELR